MTCSPNYHECVATTCWECEELMYWIPCPTGGWWKHVDHPEDNHDGCADIPEHAEEF